MRLRAWFLTVVTVVFASSQAGAVPIQWTVESGGNGHWYEVYGWSELAHSEPLPTGPSDWPDQQARAEAMGGYLMTITSAAENQFMSVDLGVGSLPSCKCIWLGGFQNLDSPSYSEPSGGWEWVTGEAWTYSNWASGEPNNSGAGQAENYLTTWFSPDPNNVSWNDHYPNGSGAFIVEWDTNPIPEPSTALLLAPGLLMLAATRRRTRSRVAARKRA